MHCVLWRPGFTKPLLPDQPILLQGVYSKQNIIEREVSIDDALTVKVLDTLRGMDTEKKRSGHARLAS